MDEWLFLSEAAAEVGLSEVTLRGYANGQSKLPLRTTKRGRFHVVSRTDFDEWKQAWRTRKKERERVRNTVD